jgi:phenylalanyl-tRNA synthetase beta chain
MPTVTLNRKVVDKLIGRKLPDERLRDRISYLGTDLEGIDGEEINVEIFPNRPDMLSEQGFSRALASFIGSRKGLREYRIYKSKDKVIVKDSVRKVRPYTACAIVKGLKFDDEKIKEIIQIQEKLHVSYGRNRKKTAIGIYPFEKIKTPIRFIALPPEKIEFQPLEFPRKINGRQILSQHPTGREYGHLLEGLDKYPIFIDADDRILSMPPIINSHDVGKITEDTKDVFIECSGFDYNVLSLCLNMIVTALADMGGKIYSMEIDFYGKKVLSPDLTPRQMELDVDYVNKKLGIKLTEKKAKDLLMRMGYGYSKGNALIPAYRADVLHQIDLVEDIAIAYGYDNFRETIPDVATIGQEKEIEIFKKKIADILVGLGLLETNSYSIISKDIQTKKMELKQEPIELQNSVSLEYNSLRTWMIPSLMQILQDNKHHEYPQKIFEMGTIFKKSQKTDTGVEENIRLAVVLCEQKADYTKIRQVLDHLLTSIGIEDYSIDAVDHASFVPGRCGRLKLSKKKLAYIGEVHPKVLENFDLEMPVAAFELNITELFGVFRNL